VKPASFWFPARKPTQAVNAAAVRNRPARALPAAVSWGWRPAEAQAGRRPEKAHLHLEAARHSCLGRVPVEVHSCLDLLLAAVRTHHAQGPEAVPAVHSYPVRDRRLRQDPVPVRDQDHGRGHKRLEAADRSRLGRAAARPDVRSRLRGWVAAAVGRAGMAVGRHGGASRTVFQ
jgi:hypothetical protein